MGKIAAMVARVLLGAVDNQLNAAVRNNGGDKRVRRLQQERVKYRAEIRKQQAGGKRR